MQQNPFLTLGIPAGSDVQVVREAYRRLAKLCHPDAVQGEAQKLQAQEKMIKLNLAYEEALKMACRSTVRIVQATPAESMRLAQRLLDRQEAASALRTLERCSQRDASWYHLHGQILHALGRYAQAHQSLRSAVRIEPENNVFRAAALKAYLAEKNSHKITSRVADWARHAARPKR